MAKSSNGLCSGLSSIGSNGSTHNLVEGSLFHLHTTLLSTYTLHSSQSYVTLYTASHNTTIDMSDVCDNSGTICALVALSGCHGMFILHVCVDLLALSPGSFIEIGLDVGIMSITGVPGKTKCHVAPVSAMAITTAILSFLC